MSVNESGNTSGSGEAVAQLRVKSEAQAKTAILQFLSELQISKIVYVDDRCSIQELKEAYLGKLKSFYQAKPQEIDFVNWNTPQAKFEKDIADLWESSADDKKRELFLQILDYEGNTNEIENSTAPLNLKNQLNDKIELYSPVEWIAEKDNILATLSGDSKILFLFDIEFEHAPLDDNRNGIDLAVDLLTNTTIKDFIYCGIFSHLFSLNEENDKRNEYCNSHSLNKEKFYTISKKRFQDDSYLPGLAEGIRNTLVINEVEFLKKESSKIIKKAFKDSLTEVEELNPESFNHVIQKSSNKEGVWELATLFRLNNIITSDKALKTLLPPSKRTKINRSLEQIRKVEKIKTGGETPFDKTKVQSLRRRELYVEERILNQLHFPLSNGDIFSINQKEYILLGQPCNLAMRSGGSRSRNYDIGFLLEIEKLSIDDYKKMGKAQFGVLGIVETPTVEAGFLRTVKFHSFRTVSLSPLDLTFFNPDGIAKIDLKKSEHDSTTIQASWKKRYKKLHKEFSEYKSGISTYKKLRSSEKNNLKEKVYYGNLFKGYNIDNNNALNRSGTILTFDIKRVSHYKQPYSADLLQQFMQYLSRNAFDHDFTNV